METKVLFTTEDIAKVIGQTKQGVNKAVREGRIEAPSFKVGRYKGWTQEQLERIKKLKRGETMKEEVNLCYSCENSFDTDFWTGPGGRKICENCYEAGMKKQNKGR